MGKTILDMVMSEGIKKSRKETKEIEIPLNGQNILYSPKGRVLVYSNREPRTALPEEVRPSEWYG